MSKPEDPEGPNASRAAVPAVALPAPVATRAANPRARRAAPPAVRQRMPDLNDPSRPLHPRRIWPD